MKYTVQQLAELTGVSVRTLHYYDEIKLLSPAREANDYRSYYEADLLRLQQILFFRELEFPLEEIANILAKPDFDMSVALKQHRLQIEQKQKRLKGLLKTIDKTLLKLAGKTNMMDDELFDAFMQKHEKEYAAEAQARWGDTDAYKQSQERLMKLSKDDLKRIAEQGEALTQQIAATIKNGPASAKTQALIARQYENLRIFYEPSPEMFRGLGQMYVDDVRFREYYEKYDPTMPEFMRDAMVIFSKTIDR